VIPREDDVISRVGIAVEPEEQEVVQIDEAMFRGRASPELPVMQTNISYIVVAERRIF
jgi:hypothetical protein